jgi:hypothetical protein
VSHTTIALANAQAHEAVVRAGASFAEVGPNFSGCVHGVKKSLDQLEWRFCSFEATTPHMTLHSFRLLAPRVQVTFALMRGTYLANRWQAGDRLMLYYLPDEARGFFVEVGHGPHGGRAVVLRSFVGSVPLEDYIDWMRLPE